ncbi:MAG: flagellar basal body-associated FliL family protein [Schwartzia sp.]|nr:flagellar basal body-associated FliL family protein [Schwartzia sp. (in: firmicutes)]
MADEKKPAAEEPDKANPEAAEGEEGAAEEKPKKKIPVMAIAIVVLVLVGIALAGGIAYFVASKLVASSHNESEGGPRYHDPGVFVKLGDPKEGILVNVGGVKAGHFLKIGIMLEMNPSKKEIITEGKMNPVAETKMMDTVLHILRSEPLDGYDAMKQDALKEKIKTEVNHELGEGSVYGVYITSFVLQ